MRILFVVPYVPNPIRVRPYELLRTLAARGHQITVATLWQSEEERHQLAALQALGITIVAEPLPRLRSLWNSTNALAGRAPLQARYCWQPTLAASLEALVAEQRFDVIHVEHLRGAAYGLLLRNLKTATGRPLPVVWDSVDCISHLFAQAARQSRSLRGRLMTRFELPRTRRYEAWLLHQFAQTLVTSATDHQAFATLIKEQASFSAMNGQQPSHVDLAASVAVLPNGVDLEEFQAEQTKKAEKTIVFSGKMSYHANVTAALHLVQEIMPHVWQQDPTIEVQLVGKDPSAQVRALASAATPTAGKVVVTGAVPAMRPYLSQATIAVAPVPYSSGIQNKVLEAMACGTPVIASPNAASGLQANVGSDLLVAQSAGDFASAILALLAQPTRRAEIGQAGRAYVEQAHAWNAIGAQLESYYRDVMARPPCNDQIK